MTNILESGLGRLPRHDVFSQSTASSFPLSKLIKPRALSQNKTTEALQVYLTGDGADVYEDSVFRLAKSDHGIFQPVLILLAIRLGIDRVTPVYWDALKASLQLPQSIGIAGSVCGTTQR